MSKKNKDEFLKIINDIENNNKFKELNNLIEILKDNCKI